MPIQPKNDTACKFDTLDEKTTDAGVTIEGMLLKDSALSTDIINESTPANGVDVEGVKHIDSYNEFSSISAPGIPASTDVRLYNASGDLIVKDDAGDTWQLTPEWQTFTPDPFTGSGGMNIGGSPVIDIAEFFQVGKMVFFCIAANVATLDVQGDAIEFLLPVTADAAAVNFTRFTAHFRNAGSGNDSSTGVGFITSTTKGAIGISPFGTLWTLGTNRRIRAQGFYMAA